MDLTSERYEVTKRRPPARAGQECRVSRGDTNDARAARWGEGEGDIMGEGEGETDRKRERGRRTSLATGPLLRAARAVQRRVQVLPQLEVLFHVCLIVCCIRRFHRSPHSMLVTHMSRICRAAPHPVVGRLEDWEIGRLGDWEIGRLGVVRLRSRGVHRAPDEPLQVVDRGEVELQARLHLQPHLPRGIICERLVE